MIGAIPGTGQTPGIGGANTGLPAAPGNGAKPPKGLPPVPGSKPAKHAKPAHHAKHAHHAAKGGSTNRSSSLTQILAKLTAMIDQLQQLIASMVPSDTSGGGGVDGCCGNALSGADQIDSSVNGASGTSLPMSGVSFKNSKAQNAYEQRVIDLINQARAKKGLGAVRFDATLLKAADSHNVQQIRTRTMAHQGIGDADPGSRIRAAGFNGHWGENVAMGQRSPEQVVREWLASPDHYRNIMDPSFTRIAMSYGTTADGLPFWTQEFGA